MDLSVTILLESMANELLSDDTKQVVDINEASWIDEINDDPDGEHFQILNQPHTGISVWLIRESTSIVLKKLLIH